MTNDLSIATIYKIFSKKNELIQHFIALQNEYANEPLEYKKIGTISMLEVNLLISIEENPNITTTELASLHRKTKAAVSQTIHKLEQKNLIYRTRCPVDSKRALLHINEDGIKITSAHRQTDLNNLRLILDELLKNATVAEVDAFFKVLELYCDIISKNLYANNSLASSNNGDEINAE